MTANYLQKPERLHQAELRENLLRSFVHCHATPCISVTIAYTFFVILLFSVATVDDNY